MHRDPVARDIDPTRDPDVAAAADVVEQPLQPDGPRRLIDRYNTLIAEARSNALSRIESAKRGNKPTDQLPDPQQIRLNMSNEWLRLLAAHALGDMDLIRPSLDELVESASQEIRHLADPALRPRHAGHAPNRAEREQPPDRRTS